MTESEKQRMSQTGTCKFNSSTQRKYFSFLLHYPTPGIYETYFSPPTC